MRAQSSRRIVLTFTALVGFAMLVLPQAASALRFEPATASPLVSPVAFPDDTISTVTTGDFDNDGFDDIAFAGLNSKNIHIYEGAADGTLTANASNPIGSNSDEATGRRMLRAFDIDDDLDLDLLAGSTGSDYPFELYLNNGNAGFQTVPNFTPSITGMPAIADSDSTSVGDLDSDGDKDFVTGVENHSFVVGTNLTTGGPGSFAFQTGPGGVTTVPVNSPHGLDAVDSTAIGDFNGDGRKDIALTVSQIASETNPDRILIYPGNSTTSISLGSPIEITTAPVDGFLRSLRTVKLNGDGFDDLVYRTDHISQVDSVDSILGGTPPTVNGGAGSSVTVPGAQDLGIADLDGDGDKDDVAVPQYNDQAFAVAKSGAGGFTLDSAGPFTIPPVGGKNFYANGAFPLDVNGDGSSDIATLSGEFPSVTQARAIAIHLKVPEPGISVAPQAAAFGDLKVGDAPPQAKTLTVTSSGDTGLLTESVALTGPDAAQFSLDDSCGSAGYSPGQTCTIEVGMKPVSRPGSFNAQIAIESNAPGSPLLVPVTAQALEVVPPPPPPEEQAKLKLRLKSPKKIKRGKVLVVKATVTNTGDAPAAAITLRTTAPKKLTKRAKAVKIPTLAGGRSITKKIKVKVKRNAKRGKKLVVKVKAGSTEPGLTVRAKRTVKIR